MWKRWKVFFRSTVKRTSKLHSTSAAVEKFTERIFSGIQPTGSLHLGNYFGAVQKWIKLQNEGKETFYSIVDLHSITTPQDPEKLGNNIFELTATLLACGINPEKSVLFLQSQVPYHSQLCWVLGCLMTLPRLDNLPQFKEKSAKMREVPLGLLVYPVLQSADILLYKATHVPVGEDQVQHLQVTRHLARLFNRKFGTVFPSPAGLIDESSSSRIKSLRDPTKKMSKSEQDPLSRIHMMDSNDQVMTKLKKSVTDCISRVTFDPILRPGVSNLITIHSLFSGLTPEQICNRALGVDTGTYKLEVAQCVVEKLEPIRRETKAYLSDKSYLVNVLKSGSTRASAVASNTWREVCGLLGLKSI